MLRWKRSSWAARLGISAAGLVVPLVALIQLEVKAQPVGMDSIQVTTYFDTQAPPEEGAPVYLTNVVGPVGKIQNIRLVPEHAQYHDRWEVVMALNAREVSKVRTDSVVYLKMPDPNQSSGGGSRAPFLEIDAGRPTSQLITNHAVLKGQVTYFAEIGWIRPPEPWWRKVTVWAFYLAVIGAVAVLVVLGRRRAPARSQTKDTR